MSKLAIKRLLLQYVKNFLSQNVKICIKEFAATICKKCVIVYSIHVSNSHTKFGWIYTNGLGGDRVMDIDCNIPIPSLFVKRWG